MNTIDKQGIVLVVIFMAFVMLLVILARSDGRSDQYDKCVRAFEYTREQCEFIMDNGVLPR